MKDYSQSKIINSSFVPVLAKDTKLAYSDIIKHSFGNEELIKETLNRCTEALQGNMIEFMTKAISKTIKSDIKRDNNKIFNEIMYSN